MRYLQISLIFQFLIRIDKMVKAYLGLAVVAAIIAYLWNFIIDQSEHFTCGSDHSHVNLTKNQLESILTPHQPIKRNVQLITVIGGPGSGKGTNCLYLKQRFGYRHISSGDLLRDQIQSRGPLSQLLQKYLIQGRLVPSQIIVRLILNSIQKFNDGDVVLLDGFPRNLQNLNQWNKVNGQTMKINYVLHFDCPENVMENRLIQRAKISGRADDNIDTIRKRLKVFQKQTKQVIRKLEEDKSVKIIKIDTVGSISEVEERVKQKMTLLSDDNEL